MSARTSIRLRYGDATASVVHNGDEVMLSFRSSARALSSTVLMTRSDAVRLAAELLNHPTDQDPTP